MSRQGSSSVTLPYPGLRPFKDNEKKIFFGRDGQVRGIIKILHDSHLAAVMGGSGSGKSSIVRAGVIPKLRAYGISEQGDFWVPITVTPGDAPITRLAMKLDNALVGLPDEQQAQRRLKRITRILEGPHGLEDFLREYGPQLKVADGLEAIRPYANLLVVIDQFEEIFRHACAKTRQSTNLVDLLVNAFDRKSERIYVIITLRTEDLHRCAAYLLLPEILNKTAFLTRRLDEDELEQVIESPPPVIARLYEQRGIPGDHDAPTFDSGLLLRLYDDLDKTRTDSDHLPLLQHLLYWLWEHAGGTADGSMPQKITEKDLDAVIERRHGMSPSGRAAGHVVRSRVGRATPDLSLLARCLEAQTDRIFDGLGDSGEYHQDVARVMFQLLAYQDNAGNFSRRWTTRENIRELAASITGIGHMEEEAQLKIVDEVIDAFEKPHPYIRKDPQSGNIDVSHEAFIRKWPRFRKWLYKERSAIDVYTQVDDQYREQKRECAGKASAIRCWVKFRTSLPRRLLRKVKKHKLLERGESWVRSYEEQRAAVVRKGTADRFSEVDRYVRKSKWFSRVIVGVVCVVGVAVPALMYWIFVVDRARTAFELETQVFQPFGVGARMAKPPSTNEPTTGTQYIVSLWEGAVALQALDKRLPGDERGRDAAASGEVGQRLRFARAVRLASSVVNEGVHSLLGFTALELPSDDAAIGDGGSWRELGPPQEASVDLKDVVGDCLKNVAPETTDASALVHVSAPADDDEAGRGVFFDSVRTRFTFYADDGWCQPVAQWGEATGSELVHIDPGLRFYVVKVPLDDGPTEGSVRYTLRGFRWTQGSRCENPDDESSCAQTWRLSTGGKISFRYAPEQGRELGLSYHQQHDRLAFHGGEKTRVFALPPPLASVVEAGVSIGSTRCDDRLKRLYPEEQDGAARWVCAMKGPLLALAREDTRSLDATGGKRQRIEILWFEKHLLELEQEDNAADSASHSGRDVIRLPIATLLLPTDTIVGMSFGEGAQLENGELLLNLKSGVTTKLIWGRKALQKKACGILDQLSDETKASMGTSEAHSTFFTEIVKSRGIIRPNNRFECICGDADCAQSSE